MTRAPLNPLQLRNPSRVVEMYVRIQNELHIFDHGKTQRSYVGYNLLSRLRQSSIHQHVPAR